MFYDNASDVFIWLCLNPTAPRYIFSFSNSAKRVLQKNSVLLLKFSEKAIFDLTILEKIDNLFIEIYFVWLA